YDSLSPTAQAKFAALFHTGWFIESLWSQTLVIHMIRTPKLPFIQSRASWQVTLLTSLGIAVGTVLPYTGLGTSIGMTALPQVFVPILAVTLLCYMLLTQVFKKIFIMRYGELL
ncbi:MAG: hypothetical protein FWG47_08415, partial [Propionibacteriaceae bacterium]|nr:hypothetical protein [Propionibacteriaceae bacterium]